MITFQEENFETVFDEALPLLREHYLEIAHFQDIELDPDVSAYLNIERAGALKLYTARNSDSELIGYACFFIRQNLHYKSSKQAMQDVIYISPKNRGFGHKFIDWIDGQLRDFGVQIVYHHVKFDHDWSVMLERMGYEKVDKVMARRLDMEVTHG